MTPESKFLFDSNPNIDKIAMGGTEMSTRALYKHVDPELLKFFNIIPSRVKFIDPEKHNIFVAHDLAGDPEMRKFQDPSFRKQFNQIVCVSEWQMVEFNKNLGIPFGEMVVVRNAIEPFSQDAIVRKWASLPSQVRMIYHTTPHRGLNILLSAFQQLYSEFENKIHLDVCSSFKVYGWGQRDEQYSQLFDFCQNHPGITYHGAVPNDSVRKMLEETHIFAYPSIWQETSCIAAIEAKASATHIVAPNYAALPETINGRTYRWSSNLIEHHETFVKELRNTTLNILNSKDSYAKIQSDARSANFDYSWPDARKYEWANLLKQHVGSSYV